MPVEIEELDASLTRVQWTTVLRNEDGSKTCQFNFGHFHSTAPNMEIVCMYNARGEKYDVFNSNSTRKRPREGFELYDSSSCGISDNLSDDEEEEFEISLYLMESGVQSVELSSRSSGSTEIEEAKSTWDGSNRPSAVWASINGENRIPLKMKESSSSIVTGKWKTGKFAVNLQVRNNSYRFESDKQFSITCVLWIQFETIGQGAKNVLKHLSDMFDQQINCDVQFQLEGEQQIGGHLNILAVRSPTFANIFKHEMSETTPGKVKIAGMQLEVFKELLIFIYSGRICPRTPMYDTKAKALYLAAFKYEIDDLKKVCVDFLCQNVSMENVISLLIWAHTYSIDQLKAVALHFLSQHGKKVCRSQDWEELARNHIELCILATRHMME